MEDLLYDKIISNKSYEVIGKDNNRLSKWLYIDSKIHQNDFIDKLLTRKTIITTGIGMSGIPHLGTVSQILNIIKLQNIGFKTQLVLGDLDAYNSRNKTYKEVEILTQKYLKLSAFLGYDFSNGIIRSQSDNLNVFRTVYKISKYVSDQDFFFHKEELTEVYKTAGVYNEIDFGIKQSITLMLGDFFSLFFDDNYSDVVVMLGIEESKYVDFAKKIQSRMNTEYEKSDNNFHALYSGLIKGFNDFPKMSKSLNGSSIDLMSPVDDIYSKFFESTDSNHTIFSIIEQLMDYTPIELNRIKSCLSEKNEEWEEYKLECYNFILGLVNFWKGL
ncbi:hypothetical protein FG877_13605 [Enterococcus casseliflavus]|nr:hypothetical protein [Enterococcus casseliflavus]